MSEAFAHAWLRAFVLTQAVEVPIYRYGYGAPLRLAFTASAITHPVVWLVFFGPLGPGPAVTYEERLVAAELFAWLTEAVFLHLTTRRPRPLVFALVANAASVIAGLTVRAIAPGF